MICNACSQSTSGRCWAHNPTIILATRSRPDGHAMSTAAQERAMVARLSQAQREKLRLHRDRAHWRTWGADRFYIERLIGEVFELHEKIVGGTVTPEQVWSEAADVANFAAMLADRYEVRHMSRAEPDGEDR